MNAEIDLGTFQYRDYFPHSKKIDQFEVLQRIQQPDRFYPFFDTFANEWFERQKSKWKIRAMINMTFDLSAHREMTLTLDV